MEVKIAGSKRKLTEDELKRAEGVVGAPLPEEYRRFLLRHNGGYPEPGDFRIEWTDPRLARAWRISTVADFHALDDGATLDLLRDFKTFQGRIPKGTLAVALDPGGNVVLLGLAGEHRGRVFFWVNSLPAEYDETDFANLGRVADGFDAFIGSLFDSGAE
ncbi:MAG TPA: SMI1/KNR4 family protein [Pyrinomonadaceae bacterium]|jgi:hypothetical protein